MKDYFVNLFHYNDWANKRLFVALPEVVDRDPSILVLFSHVVMVEKLWLGRITQAGRVFPLWEPIPLPELIRHVNDATQQWLEYLQSLKEKDFDHRVSYVNTKGIAYENTVREIAAHTVNHSTHHRGQIVLLIRKLGIDPPLIDFIAYARNE